MVLGCSFSDTQKIDTVLEKIDDKDVEDFAKNNHLYHDFCKNISERNQAIEKFALNCRKIGLMPQNKVDLLQPQQYITNSKKSTSQKSDTKLASEVIVEKALKPAIKIDYVKRRNSAESPGLQKNLNDNLLRASLDNPHLEFTLNTNRVESYNNSAVFGDSPCDVDAEKRKRKTDFYNNSIAFLDD